MNKLDLNTIDRKYYHSNCRILKIDFIYFDSGYHFKVVTYTPDYDVGFTHFVTGTINFVIEKVCNNLKISSLSTYRIDNQIMNISLVLEI